MAKQAQVFPNSCGATSLLCASVELDVAKLPASKSYSLWADAEPVLLTEHCQARVYQWTSQNPDKPENDAGNWGYSMPTDLADCAMHLGLDVQILVYSTWTATGLKFGFADEWKRLQNHPRFRAMPDDSSSYKLADNERELKVLAEWQDFVGPVKKVGALHTVLVRPNGSVMEPGGGEDHSNMTEAKRACAMHGTGLSVILRKR